MSLRCSSGPARGVPWVGLVAAFVTGCVCFLPFPSWQSLVGLIVSILQAATQIKKTFKVTVAVKASNKKTYKATRIYRVCG